MRERERERKEGKGRISCFERWALKGPFYLHNSHKCYVYELNKQGEEMLAQNLPFIHFLCFNIQYLF